MTEVIFAVLLGVLGFLAVYATVTINRDRGDQ